MLEIEGQRHLRSFIQLINRNFEKDAKKKVDPKNAKKKIDPEDFPQDSVIKREWKHIDISVRNEQNKKAIIIESKLNNAGDQPRQLPKIL